MTESSSWIFHLRIHKQIRIGTGNQSHKKYKKYRNKPRNEKRERERERVEEIDKTNFPLINRVYSRFVCVKKSLILLIT